jgi:hypothetical protein
MNGMHSTGVSFLPGAVRRAAIFTRGQLWPGLAGPPSLRKWQALKGRTLDEPM